MRWTHLLAAALGLAACDRAPRSPEDLPPGAYPHDTQRFDGYRPRTPPPGLPQEHLGVATSGLLREGEVLVLEGDAATVTSFGGGAYGIGDDNAREIVGRVLAELPDVFDTIQIFTTFEDAAQGGLAYYRPIRNEVAGIGSEAFDGRRGFGLPPEGRLSGITNMNSMELFGSFDQVVRPFSRYHSVMAQELSHRWLMYMKFRTPAGTDSDALLGRDDAHYSQLVHAYASVQDGLAWRDNGDGTFTNTGRESGFSPLDLYAMGVIGPGEVPPFFHIVDASLGGQPLEKESQIPPGATIQGQKVEVTIDQVVQAMGPRNPPKGTETPYYRAAFVLVTRPGQPRAEWAPFLAATEAVRTSFVETWKSWTAGASALCTRISSLCPEPDLSLASAAVVGGDGDEVAAPKERFRLALAIQNRGLGSADGVQVVLSPRSPKLKVHTGTIAAPSVGEGAIAAIGETFDVELGEVPCGTTVSLELKMMSREGPVFRDTIDLVVGHQTIRFDPLDEAPDWRVDPDGSDSATAGAFEIGAPEFVSVFGVVTQPAEDHTPGAAKLSFHTGVARGATFASQDLDGGRTTLESPIYTLGAALDPSLVFYAWHVATDFSNPAGPMPIPAAALFVYGSSDGGKTYEEIFVLRDGTPAWTPVKIRLADRLTVTDKMRFRFVITDPTTSGTVEAGIDDVGIVDVLPSCLPKVEDPDPPPVEPPVEEGGCRGVRTGSGNLAGLAVLGALGLLRRRRRP